MDDPSYLGDVSDAQWGHTAHHFDYKNHSGNTVKYNRKLILNAIIACPQNRMPVETASA